MFSFDVENITKGIGVITAAIALVGGGYSALEKFKDTSILKWAPEYFSISSGTIDNPFDVVVARQKLRDDCAVEDFMLEVKDSKYKVHKATPDISKFAGPATESIDKFGYSFTLDKTHDVAPGRAELLGRIFYTCPEGNVIVSYPKGLYFEILPRS